MKMDIQRALCNSFHNDNYEMMSCKSKNRYETYWQAKFVADEQMQRHKGLILDIYECKFCGGWHLASRQ